MEPSNRPPSPGPPSREPPSLEDVLEKAGELQQVVPGAVLVGGAAAAWDARHRLSTDHDHVLADLADTFETVLTNPEALGDFTLAKTTPGKIILGRLGGIETGVQQMLRQRPLETAAVTVRGHRVVVPTLAETLRIKAWLVVARNRTRDFVDVAALATLLGTAGAAEVLVAMDQYYADMNQLPEAVATQLARQMADPRPRDPQVTRELATYKQLDPRWHDWAEVVAALRALARAMVS